MAEKKKILVLDACIRRGRSRTRQLAEQAVDTLREQCPGAEVKVLQLQDLGLSWFDEEALNTRDALLAEKNYEHERFAFAREFRDADGIIVAAPFWDLSIPAVLKVYIENISVDGITFYCDEKGMHGLCRAKWMLFLSTRGGIWAGDSMEQGTTYMRALCTFFGIDSFHEVHADGVDIAGMDTEQILKEALARTRSEMTGLLESEN